MEDLNTIFTKKNITESSKNLYIKNLTRLNDGQPIKNLKFLKDVGAIMTKLEEKYKPNTQRSYIISIVSLLKTVCEDKPSYKKLYNEYYTILDKMNKDLKDQTAKTEKEQENWIGQDAVKSKWCEWYEEYKKIKDKKKLYLEEFEVLLHFLVLSLFVLQKPRRNKDYMEMYIIKKWRPDFGDKENWLDLGNKEFLFNNYKTKGTYKTQTQEIDDDLFDIIYTYLRFHPLKSQLKNKTASIPFLVDYHGNALVQNNAITRILNKIFGKKIGSSMMRKLYLTEKYSNTFSEMEKDAKAMGTSVSTIQNNYAKQDD